MSRLPTPGSDNGTWGVVLNDFLSVTHNSDGTMANASVPLAALSSGVQTSLGKADSALQSVTATSVGLANVNNTSDANKPVSTAQQTALNLKLNSADLDSTTSTLVTTPSSATATAITTQINTATAGSTGMYILAPSDPDPTTGSPAGLYFRRIS